jgi:chemotaxis signal transduction protein
MSQVLREILLFETGGRTFGLPIGDVERVVHAVRPVPLPHAPAFIEGLLNLHGTAIPVLDLNIWFGEPPREVGLSDLMIVLRAGSARVALHAEHARGVAAIAVSSIQSADTILGSAEHFSGVVMIEDEIVLLPDVASFLAAAKHIELREATAA